MHLRRYGGLMVLAVFTLVLAPAAQGDLVGPTLAMSVHAGGETVDVSVPLVELPDQAADRAKFVMHQVINVMGKGGGQCLATIDDLSVEYVADPVITLGFAVQAGSSDTTFSITSATLTFPALTHPTGEASAEMMLEDLGGSTGATAQAVAPDEGMFIATYNGTSTFAELIQQVAFSSGGPLTSDSSVGPDTIADSVDSMQSRIAMTLSAGDKASGLFVYEIVPEPATIGLLALGGVALLGRRRR